MLAGIGENQLKTGNSKFKVLSRYLYRYFPGTCTDNIYDYMKSLLWKLPDYIIMHIRTKDAFDNTPRETFEKNLKLKLYIQKELPKCKITISTPIKRHDHGKTSLTILHLIRNLKILVYHLFTTLVLELFL